MQEKHYISKVVLKVKLLQIIFIVVLINLTAGNHEKCKPEDIHITTIRSLPPSNVTNTFTITGMFPTKVTLKTRYNRSGFVWMEVARYAIAQVNKMLRLLKNVSVSLEFVFYDTCNDLQITTAKVLQTLLQSSDKNVKENCCYQKEENIIGFVGPASSSTSNHLMKLLSYKPMPVISYSATSTRFDDKEIYPLFMRTIPPDNLQAKMILDILLRFHWTHVSIIANDNEYGRMGMQELQKLFTKHDICTAVVRTFTYPYVESEMEDIIKNLKKDEMSRVIILWASGVRTQKFLLMSSKYKLYNKTWIVTESVGTNPAIVNYDTSVVQGLLSVVPYAGVYTSFEQTFWKMSYRDHANQNIWLRNVFQNALKLKGSALDNATIGGYRNRMPMSKNGYIRNAIFAYGTALKHYVTDNTVCTGNICHVRSIPNSTYFFHKYLQKVIFSGLDGETVSFDKLGNINSATFDLYSLQGKKNPLTWTKIGSWNKTQKLKVINGSFKWAGNTIALPKSRCAEKCIPGYYAIFHNSKKCCWKCIPCNERNIKTALGNQKCKICPTHAIPNLNKTKCISIEHIYISYNDENSIYIYVFVIAGVSFTAIFIFIFVSYRKTPVVLSSQFHISLLQLISFFLLNASMVLFLAKPSKTLCTVRGCLYGFLLTLAISVTLVKTQRLLQVFQARRRLSQRNKLQTVSKEVGFMIFLLVIEAALLVGVYLIKPFDVVEENFTKYKKYVNCNTKSLYYIQILYAVILALFCGVQAFRGRKLPQNYNETRFIAVAMFAAIVVLVISIPLHESRPGEPERAVIVTTITISTNCLIMIIMYGYKIWIILARPDQNCQKAFKMNILKSVKRRVEKDIERRMSKEKDNINIPNNKSAKQEKYPKNTKIKSKEKIYTKTFTSIEIITKETASKNNYTIKYKSKQKVRKYSSNTIFKENTKQKTLVLNHHSLTVRNMYVSDTSGLDIINRRKAFAVIGNRNSENNDDDIL